MRTRRANGRAPDCAAPFCSSRRNMGPNRGAVEHLQEVGARAQLCQSLKEGVEYPASAESREPLPHGIPVAILGRERSPRDVLNREKVKRLQKRRSSRPLSPRRGRQPRNTSRAISQSASVILVSIESVQLSRPAMNHRSQPMGILPGFRPHGLDMSVK